MIIPPLRRKMIRDLRRLWAQVLAIALVLAAGVSTLILGSGAYESLDGTRARFYAENRFADVFASVTRAPVSLAAEIAALDGVLVAEPRIRQIALLDMPDLAEPGSVALVSLPETLNLLYLRQGRLPDPQASAEVVVSEGFAAAHRLRPGASFGVLMHGVRRELQVVGIGLSPEFVYALGPGEAMPDPRRFGVVWMARPALAAAHDLQGSFSDLAVKLAPGASEAAVIAGIDAALARYGGSGAQGRKDQLSHAFLDAELNQLRAMTRVLPPIFLSVAALLVNMTLARLIALEREQIGLLKAIGYDGRAIAQHYIEFVAMIAVVGIVIGWLAGGWLGAGMAQMYAKFFSFPYLVFARSPGIYALAAVVTLAAAVGGALNAVRGVLRLPPAVAMAPPAPPVYHARGGWIDAHLGQTRRMILRHLTHRPGRSAASVLGVAMAVAILVGSLWAPDSLNLSADITFRQSGRQDATIMFTGLKPARAVTEAARLPGVLAAEPFRTVDAVLHHRNLSRRIALTGAPAEPRLQVVLDADLRPMRLPDDGLILSEALARALGVRPGDLVTVDVNEGRRGSLTLPVRALSLGYLGLSAQIEISALNRLMREGAAVSGVHLRLDPGAQPAFFAAVKQTPATAFVSVKALTYTKFKSTIAQNMTVMLTVYMTLAAIIAVGVVYNFARISLSEQGRELASLRVLGFTPAEVSGVLFGELALIVALAQPLGWLIGWGVAAGLAAAFSSDLYRVPLVLHSAVFATASLVVITAAVGSAALVRGRINRLDMIEVLKTRE